MKNKTKWFPVAALLATFGLCLAAAPAQAQRWKDLKKSEPLTLQAQGSFFVDGAVEAIDTKYLTSPSYAGNIMTNQMYVQFQFPKAANTEYPIVFVHGCCLTSKTWETTPDGRMGWYEYFTRQGFRTFMAEQVGRGRSGFDPTRFAKVNAGDGAPADNPDILIATDRFAWNVFRWGDYDTKTPYEGQRFPMQTVGVGEKSTNSFYKQVIPDLNATLSDAASPNCNGGTCTPPAPDAPYNSPDALAQLANQLDGVILVGHSQSSSFPTRAALRGAAKTVKGIIQLETGCFTNLTPEHIKILKKIPILIMVGDNYKVEQPTPECVQMRQQINDAGGDMTFISLPAIGIKGNSHMFMQDTNNLQVADVITKWIKDHVEKDRGHKAAKLD
ncbi:hypothetical protein IHQ68_01040 [Chelatococcus sambhunathii]|uniref:Alpha/beta hydrolase family n=1 Tax=Chelatococcus sambhunathii TaxID=363953 RepID=A0ABU1DAT8_9HYPH|nr:hypothetical protein [Chelatococcus sambhunathii]MDR4305212.1 hypothetical protein [Chelatococcus sambhunathii]